MNELMFQLIEENFIAVVVTSFLILFAYTNNNFKKNINRYFLGASLCILCLIIEEAWEARLALAATPATMRIVLSAIGYTLRPMIPLFLCLTVKKYSKKQLILLYIPLIVNGLAAFSSLFCKVSFGYTPDNKFVRGPLGMTPFIVAGLYIIILLAQTAKKWRKGGFKEALIVSAIVILAFLSTVMESVFGFAFIQNPCMAVSVTFYYLFLHTNKNNRDQLTGALTRRRFFLDADQHKSSMTAIISLDLNNLKLLNDQYGHVEGDKALVTVTNIIQKYMGSRASLYRTGGDEFMVLCYKLDEEVVTDIIKKIRADLSKTKYRCAIGYAKYSDQESFESACHVADTLMYEDKRKMKEEI